MRKRLPQSFFKRPTLLVAGSLLGKFLVRRFPRACGIKEIALKIVEVEAYDGPLDRASHAHKGKTSRNAPMFEEGGYWYVYLCYGVHSMLNIVVGPKDYPAAVLIRGVEGVIGPGRVTQKFFIDKELNTKEAKVASGLWIEDRGVRVSTKQIQRAPRVGVHYAGKIWTKKPYRFIVKNMK